MKLFIFSALLLVSSSNLQTTSAKKKWLVEDKLIWKDFLGKVPENPEHSAFTVFNFDIKTFPQADSVEIELIASFHKKESWVKKDHLKDAYLLSHEQFHFDIGEWYARKLRQKLFTAKYTVKTFNTQLNKIIKDVQTEMHAATILYDKQTNHSLIKEQQALWEKKITEGISLLNAFSKTRIKVVVK